MSIIKDIREGEYFYEGEVFCKLFGTEIEVVIDLKSADFEYAEKCAVALNNMSEEIIDKLCEYSVLYCEDFCDQIGAEPPIIESARDILRYVHPGSLSVDIPQDESIVIHLDLNCDWDEEHGLEWLVKDDKILHVGAFSDEPAYTEDSYYYNSWNYANLKKR